MPVRNFTFSPFLVMDAARQPAGVTLSASGGLLVGAEFRHHITLLFDDEDPARSLTHVASQLMTAAERCQQMATHIVERRSK